MNPTQPKLIRYTRRILEPLEPQSKKSSDQCHMTRPSFLKPQARLSTWGAWSLCDKTCAGGQTFRERTVEAHEVLGSWRPWPRLNTYYIACACGVQLAPWRSLNALTSAKCIQMPQSCMASVLRPECSLAVQKLHGVLMQVEAKGGGKLCEDRKGGSDATRSSVSGGRRDEKSLRELEDSLKETMPCNEMDCSLDPEARRELRSCLHSSGGVCRDCQLSIWADWSECTTSCGQGLRTRTREVAAKPLVGGLGCSADLKQVEFWELKKAVDARWKPATAKLASRRIAFGAAGPCGHPAVRAAMAVRSCRSPMELAFRLYIANISMCS